MHSDNYHSSVLPVSFVFTFFVYLFAHVILKDRHARHFFILQIAHGMIISVSCRTNISGLKNDTIRASRTFLFILFMIYHLSPFPSALFSYT
ncbi:MAG: hypothetical protein EXX96DRAFT_575873 [Benjaminiella poitrasii]|nr:MAG: hypothetical protein EXX96DRAFT_575873 [Benjaminiella poitrasii]